MRPEQAARQLREDLNLPRTSGAVWVRMDETKPVLVVRLSPSGKNWMARLPLWFAGYEVRMVAPIRHLAATR